MTLINLNRSEDIKKAGAHCVRYGITACVLRDIITEARITRMRYYGARFRNEHDSFTGKPEGHSSLWRSRHEWQDYYYI
jgi:hypothetical protein